jgi:hypothetical protein
MKIKQHLFRKTGVFDAALRVRIMLLVRSFAKSIDGALTFGTLTLSQSAINIEFL